MTQYKRIGIDTSKAVFTLHGIDQQDRPVLRVGSTRYVRFSPHFSHVRSDRTPISRIRV
jgi:hypothetical protein